CGRKKSNAALPERSPDSGIAIVYRQTQREAGHQQMNKHHPSVVRILAAASFLQIIAANTFAEIKHDYGTYPVPPAPSLPAAGGTIVDPTFETTIMRLTDANDGPDCINAY